jgi:tRNA nucleotidyltransferase (CCA-adding enzyme)
VILPEWDAMVGVEQRNPHHSHDVAKHTLITLREVKNDKILRLVMLFHDMGKPQTKTTDARGVDHFIGHDEVGEKIAHDVMYRLKFDKGTIKKVTKLIAYHDYPLNTTARGVRRAINRIGVDIFPYYMAVRVANIKGGSFHDRKLKLEKVIRIRNHYRKTLLENQCTTLEMLALTGQDLIQMGLAPGPEIGRILNEVLEFVIDYPKYNNRMYLLPFTKKLIEKMNLNKLQF